MTSGELAAIATVVGALFSFMGITGIDSGVISNAISGVISLVTIAAAIVAWRKHKTLAASQNSQPIN